MRLIPYFLAITFTVVSFFCMADPAAPTQDSISNTKWAPYPADLVQFDYSGEKLKENWSQLSKGTDLPWPDALYIRDMMLQFPQLSSQLKSLAEQQNAPTALKNILKDDYQALALTIQQLWRLHYQGQYEAAYSLGMSLGPAGMGPALYSKLIYTTHLVTEPDEKERLFLEVDQVISSIMPFAKDYTLLTFGDAYQKARRLELMSTSGATSSGILGSTQDKLEALHESFPNNPLYSAMLAGFNAGIIERVGNFVGSLTYGADEELAVSLFSQALQSHPDLAVLHNEFAQALIRLDNSDYDNLLITTLKQCAALTVYSAEEALNQQSCHQIQQRYELK